MVPVHCVFSYCNMHELSWYTVHWLLVAYYIVNNYPMTKNKPIYHAKD